MVAPPLVPAGERRPGCLLHDGPVVVVPGEVADSGQVREPGHGGERAFSVLVPSQEMSAADPAERLQVLADFWLVVTLVVPGSFLRRPPAPDPRDHGVIVAPPMVLQVAA